MATRVKRYIAMQTHLQLSPLGSGERHMATRVNRYIAMQSVCDKSVQPTPARGGTCTTRFQDRRKSTTVQS